MKRFFLFIALLMPLALTAQTAKTRADLYTEVDANLASGQPITAAMLRATFKNTVASSQNGLTDGVAATRTGAETLTNKRVTRRVATPASATTITPNCDTADVVKVNALTHNTTIGTPTGTPTEAQTLMIELRASGADRTVNFSSDFRIPSSSALTLPVTVVSGTKTKFFFTRDNDSAKWDFASAVTGY